MKTVNAGVTLIAALVVLALPRTSSAEVGVRPVLGPIVLAVSSPDRALFIWDATPYVAQLRSDRVFGDVALHSIEATAMAALADRSKSLASNSVSLRVTYARTGAVSPVYGTPAFAGVEIVLTISGDRKAIAAHGAAWCASLAKGVIPRPVSIAMSGTLPPQQ